MQETRVQSLGWEDPLEKEVLTHANIPAWEIPGTEEPGGLQSMWLQKDQTRDQTKQHLQVNKVHLFIIKLSQVMCQGNVYL